MKRIATLFTLTYSLLLATPLWAETSTPALHSLSVQQDNIIFEVTSYGCSRDDDFEVQVESATNITLIRKRADRCKRAPMVIRIKRPLTANGLSLQQPFSVRNPFTPPPVKRNPSSKNHPAKIRASEK